MSLIIGFLGGFAATMVLFGVIYITSFTEVKR